MVMIATVMLMMARMDDHGHAVDNHDGDVDDDYQDDNDYMTTVSAAVTPIGILASDGIPRDSLKPDSSR